MSENIWFTSDLHFNHKNIIEYCNRPYKHVDEMNEALIKNWNDRIEAKDRVYIIGDFAMGNVRDVVNILRRLKGRKFLIRGNHDKGFLKKKEFVDFFEWVKDLYTLKVPDSEARNGNQRIELCHYAMEVWDGSHKGAWHIYGHSHGTLDLDPTKYRLDVGVDNVGMCPVNYDYVKEYMKKNVTKFVPVDHHQ